MAGNRLTTWDRNNLIITKDYSFRFSVVETGEPRLYIKLAKNQQQQDDVSIVQWWHGKAEETAAWKWVGMDYDTAMDCADYARNLLTYTNWVWEYGAHVENGAVVVGWFKWVYSPQLDSSIQVVKHGNGDLYDVEVNAKVITDDYSLTPNGTNVTGSRILASTLPHIDGWNLSPTPNGKYFTSASADNIVLVAAPTWKRKFDITGVDLSTIVPNGQTLSGYTFSTWYKERTTYSCQLKYTGMTREACKNLFNSLNSTTGWWKKYHPSIWYFDMTNKEFVWQEQTQIWMYQCLNEFNAHPTSTDGRLWEAELSLTQWSESYTTNPNATWTPTWPAEWANIPALSNYLT